MNKKELIENLIEVVVQEDIKRNNEADIPTDWDNVEKVKKSLRKNITDALGKTFEETLPIRITRATPTKQYYRVNLDKLEPGKDWYSNFLEDCEKNDFIFEVVAEKEDDIIILRGKFPDSQNWSHKKFQGYFIKNKPEISDGLFEI